jgi:hypothetical protein
MMRFALILLSASLAYASDYGDALAAWLHVAPITPHVEWHTNQQALLDLHVPGYTAQNGWMYRNDTQTIYAYHCANDASSMRHETFHALAHARLPRIPRWLNEGTAVMMERLRVTDGKLQFTTNNRIRVAARSDVTLLQIVEYTGDDFGGDRAELSYAASYAAVLWMHQAGTLQTWLHGEPTPLDPATFRAWLSDPWGWP